MHDLFQGRYEGRAQATAKHHVQHIVDVALDARPHSESHMAQAEKHRRLWQRILLPALDQAVSHTLHYRIDVRLHAIAHSHGHETDGFQRVAPRLFGRAVALAAQLLNQRGHHRTQVLLSVVLWIVRGQHRNEVRDSAPNKRIAMAVQAQNQFARSVQPRSHERLGVAQKLENGQQTAMDDFDGRITQTLLGVVVHELIGLCAHLLFAI